MQQVKKEICGLCSTEHDIVLPDRKEAVKFFSWETIWLELEHNIPTLMTLWNCWENIPSVTNLSSAFVLPCCWSSNHQIQKAISVLVYGNGTSKEVSTSHFFAEAITLYTCWFLFQISCPVISVSAATYGMPVIVWYRLVDWTPKSRLWYSSAVLGWWHERCLWGTKLHSM